MEASGSLPVSCVTKQSEFRQSALGEKKCVVCLGFSSNCSRLALLVRFSKISCRWDYSSTLGREACGLRQCFVKTPSIRQTSRQLWGRPKSGRGLQTPTQGQAGSPRDLYSGMRLCMGACHSSCKLTFFKSLRSSPCSRTQLT